MDGILDFMRTVQDSPRGLLDFVTGLLLAHGYLIIFLGAALDNFGLPASGDVVLLAGGFFANGERAALPLVMLWGFLGATVSDHAVDRAPRRAAPDPPHPQDAPTLVNTGRQEPRQAGALLRGARRQDRLPGTLRPRPAQHDPPFRRGQPYERPCIKITSEYKKR